MIMVMVRLFHRLAGQQPLPILHIPHGSSIFKFTSSKNDATRPFFSNLEWKIKQGESWAIIANASEEKAVLIETLKSHTRISPSPALGLWPFLTASDLSVDPTKHIRAVSFRHTPQGQSAPGQFCDYSARYGAVREQDRVTLHQYLLDNDAIDPGAILHLSETLELTQFLYLPLIALSNGQMRRARIIKAILHHPKVLILDEPLTGLDVFHRPRLLSLLESLRQSSNLHIILSLRKQDPIPDWVTHLFFIHSSNRFYSGLKQHILPETMDLPVVKESRQVFTPATPDFSTQDVVVDLQKVNVKYHDRHILKNVTWTIRQGERWILSGPNGSGKTTLLSLIMGDHPQSYTQSPPASIRLFSKPRKQLATPTLARLIGISSPEIFDAFPRRMGRDGLTVLDAIGTGFEGVFTFRRLSDQQEDKVLNLLKELGPGPDTWTSISGDNANAFASRLFATLAPGEQSLVLLLRALISEPQLLILDEAFSGMDSSMIRAVSEYLRKRVSSLQAVVWISHWEDECPWKDTGGVKFFTMGSRRV